MLGEGTACAVVAAEDDGSAPCHPGVDSEASPGRPAGAPANVFRGNLLLMTRKNACSSLITNRKYRSASTWNWMLDRTECCVPNTSRCEVQRHLDRCISSNTDQRWSRRAGCENRNEKRDRFYCVYLHLLIYLH